MGNSAGKLSGRELNEAWMEGIEKSRGVCGELPTLKSAEKVPENVLI